MGRANGSQHASGATFNAVFGARRGSARGETPAAAVAELAGGQLVELPYRVARRASDRCEFDPADRSVKVCERCGQAGFLLRAWEAKSVPALCFDCHDELQTETGANYTGYDELTEWGCETWCRAPVDHTGLCHC